MTICQKYKNYECKKILTMVTKYKTATIGHM